MPTSESLIWREERERKREVKKSFPLSVAKASSTNLDIDVF
jgi:hypothetical protein